MKLGSRPAGRLEEGRTRLLRGAGALREYGILIALAVLVLIVQAQNDRFLTEDNLSNISRQWAGVAIMAVGMTFVLIGGGFDLSVGATFAFAATLSASISLNHSTALAVTAALGVSVAVGVVNGFLITRLNINPFITTLAMALVLRGFALIYSNGQNYVVSRPDVGGNAFFDALGSGKLGPVPVAAAVAVGVLLLGGLVLRWTAYGRGIYAVGGNTEAAYLSGMPTALIRGSTYVVTGVTAAIAGLLWVGRLGSGAANIAVGVEFDVIAAALIGGISLAGGEGAIWRATVGVAVLAVLQNFFNQSHIGAFWQIVAKGFIILGAVGLDAYSKRPHKRPWGVKLRRLRTGLTRRDARRELRRGEEEPPSRENG